MTELILGWREASFLHGGRVLAWGRVLAVLAVAGLVALAAVTHLGTRPDPFGRPFGTDFSSFWAAGKLALAGSAAASWDPAAHAAAERSQFSPDAGFAPDYYAFFYPPPFLLLCAPLALLPYGFGLIVWLAATGAAYVGAVRALLPRAWPGLLAPLAMPAFLTNAGHGQNAALSAALFGVACAQMDRRPCLAGACLGALCFKPQLALPILPALLAAGRWRTLAAAGASAGLLGLLSLLIFGPAPWQHFMAAGALARVALESGAVGFGKMVSPFAAVRLLGGPVALAWAVQAIASIGACVAATLAASRRCTGAAELATLAAAACVATPFLLDYDLLILAVPMAWVAAEAEASLYLPWEKAALAAAALLPLVARPLALAAGIPTAPLVTAAMLAIVLRRAMAGPDATALVRSRRSALPPRGPPGLPP